LTLRLFVAGVERIITSNSKNNLFDLHYMTMLPAPVNHVLDANNHILDGTPSTVSPHHLDSRYTHPTPSLPNTDEQDESRNSVNQRNDKRTRRFVCQHCGRKFLRAEHLRRHEITRTLNVEE
jgi:hypothetical protein